MIPEMKQKPSLRESPSADKKGADIFHGSWEEAESILHKDDDPEAGKKKSDPKSEEIDYEDHIPSDDEGEDTTELRNRIAEYHELDDNDDDEFYNRAKKPKSNAVGKKGVETAATLTAKKKVFDTEMDQILSQINEVDKDLKKGTTPGGDDSLDSFMSSLSTSDLQNKKKKLEIKLREVEVERNKVIKLLNISKPALDGLTKKQMTSSDLKQRKEMQAKIKEDSLDKQEN